MSSESTFSYSREAAFPHPVRTSEDAEKGFGGPLFARPLASMAGISNGRAWLPILAAGVITVAGVAYQTAYAAPPGDNYKKLCRTCHGDDGKGSGPAARVLDKQPGDFTDCQAMKAQKREFLVKIIAEGGRAVGRSAQMPASGKKLSPKEIEELADYVATHFCEGE
jgi:cytochrome c oxidase cbb3-type subunit 3